MLLTPDELRELTGLERPAAQLRELQHLGIPYRRRRDGSLVVSILDIGLSENGPARPVYVRPNDFELKYQLWETGLQARRQRARDRLCVLPLDLLRGLPEVAENDHHAGVYFLWAGPELQYVGQSRYVSQRVAQHAGLWGRKTFCRATWLRVTDDATRWYEQDYVRRYRPPQNLTSHG